MVDLLGQAVGIAHELDVNSYDRLARIMIAESGKDRSHGLTYADCAANRHGLEAAKRGEFSTDKDVVSL